jgi:hypothetical protein
VADAQSGGMTTRSIAQLACAASFVVAGCSSVGVGVGIPIGGPFGVGVSVGSDGRIGGSVGASTGGVGVGVGGSTSLPRRTDAPAPSASSASNTTR